MKQSGSHSIVYLDESGFNSGVYRPHGWGAKGQRIYGDCSGKRLSRTSLLLAQCEAFFASVVFRDWYNGTVQPVVRTVIDSVIEAGADSGDGQCSDTQK